MQRIRDNNVIGSLKLARFGVECSNCSEILIVNADEREAGLCCAECGCQNGPWPKMPSQKFVPKEDATLSDFIRFSRMFNPFPHFEEIWGDEYTTKVGELWQRCVRSFKEDMMGSANVAELLMCLQYDIALGPYLGVPDTHKVRFLKWLVEGIKSKLN